MAEEQAVELAELQPKVAQQKQQKRQRTRRRTRRKRLLLPGLWCWRSWRGGGS
ncbi:hypothetical protein [Saccharopolyspora spinosa]|uniref:hypothetical protein n=1 Tax=Saccharopolyspora spinosa TaxID=60894 RepID=UPI00376EA509